MEVWKARKSVSQLSAQPTEILGTKLKLPRQRALVLGRMLAAHGVSFSLPQVYPPPYLVTLARAGLTVLAIGRRQV